VLKVPAIFQIAEHQVHLEVDKYVEPRSPFVSWYGDLSDIRDNQITPSVLEWLMSRVEFVMPRMKGNNSLSVCNGSDVTSVPTIYIHENPPIFYFFIDRHRDIFHPGMHV
jgi:hypothetical protein